VRGRVNRRRLPRSALAPGRRRRGRGREGGKRDREGKIKPGKWYSPSPACVMAVIGLPAHAYHPPRNQWIVITPARTNMRPMHNMTYNIHAPTVSA
jgi:hypothetical protein